MKTQNICHKVAEDQEDMLKLVSNHVPYLFASQLNSVPTFSNVILTVHNSAYQCFCLL